jgi:amino acid transporter
MATADKPPTAASGGALESDVSVATRRSYTQLKANAMGTPGVTFLVLAGVTPLAAFMAILPLGIAFGSGAGFPGIVLIAVIALACFAVGYVAMSKKIPVVGAFYAYVSRGINRSVGAGAAIIAVIAYLATVMSMAGNSGFFASTAIADNGGPHVHWWIISIAVVVVAGILATFGIDVSAKIVMVLCTYEFVIVMMVVVAIFAKDGLSAFTFSSFNPRVIFQGAPGVGLVFAFTLFLGFEATAIYSEESRNPEKTIGRATYISLSIISIVYILVAMSLVAAYGAAHVQDIAANDPGGFAVATAKHYLGGWAGQLFEWGIIASLFAAILGIHNSGSRYLFAMGVSGLLPRWLGRVSKRYGSPITAVIFASCLELVVVIVCAVGGVDPFIGLGGVGAAVGTFGIVILQATAAASVVGFFWSRDDKSWVRTIILPGIGSIMLFVATGLTIYYFNVLTGSSVAWINALPWVVIGLGACGTGYALWLRSYRPQRYAVIGRAMEEKRMEDIFAEEAKMAEAETLGAPASPAS